MRRVLFLSKGEQSASTRYRAFNYFPELKKHGWDAAHLGLHEGVAGKLQILRSVRNADVVVLLRHGLSFPFLPLLRKYSRKLVFDFDDAVFLKSDGTVSALRSRRFDKTVALCDRVWAGNHYLAERALAVNPGTIVLPTSVDMSRYLLSSRKPAETVDLVWIGSSSTRKYLEDILPVLERAALLFPRLRLKIIADFSLESKALAITAIPWREETETLELCSSHIGIAPMRDDLWTRGKCALKVLQYMASGLPVISSRAGVNAEVVRHEETGFLATSEQNWIDSIVSLAEKPLLRERMGQAGHALCEQRYSRQVCAELMIAQLQEIAG